MPTVYAGSDVPITITINQGDGTPLPLGNASDILVVAYLEQGVRNIKKWSKVSAEGFELLEVLDAPEGIIKCILTAEETQGIAAGRVLCDVKVKIEDPDFDDGDFESVQAGIELFELKHSRLSNA